MLSFGWVISQLCREWVTPLTPAQLVQRFGLASGAALAAPVPVPLEPGQPLACAFENSYVNTQQLVGQLARHVNHTGSDVSITMGTPFNSKGGNHASIRANWWTWKNPFSFPVEVL